MQENQTISVYSDESHHLHNQGAYMVIGSLWSDTSQSAQLAGKVALIKKQHGIAQHREIKWTKVSPAKIEYYEDLVKLFFQETPLNFRAIIVSVQDLRHGDFGQTEDEFYYKMQYLMLTNIVRKNIADFKIYLDYKDTWSNVRCKRLVNYLDKTLVFAGRTFDAQPIRSYESIPMQLADLFIGAVAYANNDSYQEKNSAKASLVKLIEVLAGQKLTDKTPYDVEKYNLFRWSPQQK